MGSAANQRRVDAEAMSRMWVVDDLGAAAGVKMNITEMVAVMLAYENGAKIEMSCFYDELWTPIDQPTWNWSVCEYRVAEFPEEQDNGM
jgi:hypothetical protein